MKWLRQAWTTAVTPTTILNPDPIGARQDPAHVASPNPQTVPRPASHDSDSKPKRSGLSFIQLMRMCRDSSLDFIKAFGQIFDSNTAKKKTGPKIYTTTSAWPSLPAVRQCPTVDLSPPLLRIKVQNTSKGINNYH